MYWSFDMGVVLLGGNLFRDEGDWILEAEEEEDDEGKFELRVNEDTFEKFDEEEEEEDGEGTVDELGRCIELFKEVEKSSEDEGAGEVDEWVEEEEDDE